MTTAIVNGAGPAMGNETAPRAVYSDLRRAEHKRTVWRYVVPDDVDWRSPLATSYWGDALNKLTPGDRIEVVARDFAVQYELAVLEVIDLAGYLRLAARPLFPADLVLPEVRSSVERPRYGVRPDGDGGFAVTDDGAGKTIKDRLDRSTANDLAHARNEADKLAITAATAAGGAASRGGRR